MPAAVWAALAMVLVLGGVVLRGRNLVRAQAGRRQVYQRLRDQVVGGTARDLCIAVPEGKHVWGMLMEMGLPNAVATIVALRDGNASIYLSNGGGTLGGGGYESIRRAALRANDAAEGYVDMLKRTDAFPPPHVGEVAFYVMTLGGAYTGSATEADLRQPTHPLCFLYMAGQEVVTQFRLLDQRFAAPAPAP